MFRLLLLYGLNISSQVDSFSPGLGISCNARCKHEASLLFAEPKINAESSVDFMPRRKALFSFIAAAGSTITPFSANASTPKKPATDETKSTSSVSSSSVANSQVAGPNLVPLSILSLGTLIASKTLSKDEGSPRSSLYVEPTPYGLREGRNYWKGIDLAAASSASSSANSTKKATMSSISSVNPSLTDELATPKKGNSSPDVSSAFFIKTEEQSGPKQNEESKMVDIENSRPKPEPQLTSSLKSLLVNKNTPNSNPKVPSITAADVTETTDNELISDDERMVLEAQKEAEEAEMLLREAEAEAARVDQELAKLGISASHFTTCKRRSQQQQRRYSILARN